MSYHDNLQKLLDTKIHIGGNEKIDSNLYGKYHMMIKDNDYFDFIIKSGNAGFFLDYSLHFYSFTTAHNYLNIDFVNNVFLRVYGNYATDLCAIGQDVFGNQFVCDLSTQSFFLFQIETAEKEKLANNFKEFIDILFTDIDYYSGRSFILNWGNSIEPNQRLCPKKPFVIGGGYNRDNFYTSFFPKYLEFFADVAKQINELPDGTPIKLKITDE